MRETIKEKKQEWNGKICVNYDQVTEMPMVLFSYHINIPLFGFSCASIELIVFFGISKGTNSKRKWIPKCKH